MTDVFVFDTVRTPFGKYGGALSGVRPDDLGAHVVVAGGVESMSRAPWVLPKPERAFPGGFGLTLDDLQALVDVPLIDGTH